MEINEKLEDMGIPLFFPVSFPGIAGVFKLLIFHDSWTQPPALLSVECLVRAAQAVSTSTALVNPQLDECIICSKRGEVRNCQRRMVLERGMSADPTYHIS